MSRSTDNNAVAKKESSRQEETLEAGAYEVIRNRLEKYGDELRDKLEKLNHQRVAIFGGVEFNLLSTSRLTTDVNCVPQDMSAIGSRRFIFGYNVQMGLRSSLDVSDVFSVYDYDTSDHSFHLCKEPVLEDPRFVEDFEYLFRYYKGATFLKFLRVGTFLYMGIKVGREVSEIKVFKWLVDEEAGGLSYVGNRFDHEFTFPSNQEFDWKRAHRDMYRHGLHPHVSIEDRVFVETVGGDLTIKVDDNTSTGTGIYSEPVENRDQTLDDAEIHYAIIGNLILLKILPYQEKTWRYLVYNERTQEVVRLDGIAESCVLLPDDHGLMVPKGYVLQTGEVKLFDTGLPPLKFERRVSSRNGEDTLFVFNDLQSGTSLLMSYNLIQQGVETPMVCRGFSLFGSGELLLFQAHETPQKHHVVQVWQTPIITQEHGQSIQDTSYLGKVGNAEIVRVMAECKGVLTLLSKEDSFADLYVELVRQTSAIADSYFWLERPETENLKSTLLQIKSAAEAALGEFEKVRRMRKSAQEQVNAIQAEVSRSVANALSGDPDQVGDFVKQLTLLREQRGRIIALKEIRYTNLDLLKHLDQQVVDASDKLSDKCVNFLLEEEALLPYREQIHQLRGSSETAKKVLEAEDLEKSLQQTSAELELLISVVGGLKIKDATETTRIVENISSLFAELNQTRSILKNRRDELLKLEGAAEFQAQLSLLNQSVLNFVEVSATPEKCDESLTQVLVQIEELEGRFADFDQFAEELTNKREEIQEIFQSRRQSLIDARNRRVLSLVQSAERILTSVRNRLASFVKPEEVHAWLASDMMVAKLRDLIEELSKLGDTVQADTLRTKLKSLQQDSLKQIRDKEELFVGSGDLIQFGKHHFSVNRQPLDLTLIAKDDAWYFHLTGTKYNEAVVNEALLRLRDYWHLSVVSESTKVYRSEFLAWNWSKSIQTKSEADHFLSLSQQKQVEVLRDFMHQRFQEGYTKGVHDHDAALIAAPLIQMQKSLGPLRHSPSARALAVVVWLAWPEGESKRNFLSRMQARGRMRMALGVENQQDDTDLQQYVRKQLSEKGDRWVHLESAVVECLIEELQWLPQGESNLPVTRSNAAIEWCHQFKKALQGQRASVAFEDSMKLLEGQVWEQFYLTLDWLKHLIPEAKGEVILESAALLVSGQSVPLSLPVEAPHEVEVRGMMGAHPLLVSGAYTLNYHDFTSRLREHEEIVTPAYHQLVQIKHQLIESRRSELRLDQFKAGILTSFVRNRLIDSVYLPIIGANLAKQMGAANDTRTDRMGLLLLISPPGYGKTTLMEYVANRLGMTLVKINGPALGHHVTSLDPSEAPNAGAREEIEKLNLALEMGDNVMIYVDDIQHTHPEFLQKFISLCDGSRRMEGVFKGQAKTYDLRGRKVAVVMAGNPYTEVGGKFQVPDMLANRADTYNLGEILGGHQAAFKDSYIENCLTSNPVLSRIAAKSHSDALSVLKIAQTGSREDIEFDAAHNAEEINDAVAVMKHLLTVREVVLRVNQEYIKSAATEDAYRTEPAFKLQGSYRNMNKIAEKILPMMSEAEVQSIVEDHYRSESQTLSKAAEANLLKWREIIGLISDAETERWNEIKKTFRRNLLTGGADENDPVSRISGQLNAFSVGLEKIEQAVQRAAGPSTLADATIEHLQKIIEGLRAVPVNVEITVQPVEKPHHPMESEVPIDIVPKVQQGD